MGLEPNKHPNHQIVSDQGCPNTPAIPEESQVLNRPFNNKYNPFLKFWRSYRFVMNKKLGRKHPVVIDDTHRNIKHLPFMDYYFKNQHSFHKHHPHSHANKITK